MWHLALGPNDARSGLHPFEKMLAFLREPVGFAGRLFRSHNLQKMFKVPPTFSPGAVVSYKHSKTPAPITASFAVGQTSGNTAMCFHIDGISLFLLSFTPKALRTRSPKRLWRLLPFFGSSDQKIPGFALPTIVFYILLFLVIFFAFGSRFAMVLTGPTTLFQLRHKQRNDARTYLILFFVPIVLCLLAYAASRTAVLCALLNFGVPFFLVIWRSSQFEPKGHFGFAMTFVFLELMPPSPEELGRELLAMVLCQVALLAALWLSARRWRPADPRLQVPAGLHRLSELMEQMAVEGPSEAVDRELYDTAQRLHQLGYARRRLLLVLWSMFSQLEQIGCLVQSELVEEEDYPRLDALAEEIARAVSPPRAALRDLRPDGISQADLLHLLTRYLSNGRQLLELRTAAR